MPQSRPNIDLFKDVQRKTNVSILFITHDFGWFQMCHRVAVMYAGKIVGLLRLIIFKIRAILILQP